MFPPFSERFYRHAPCVSVQVLNSGSGFKGEQSVRAAFLGVLSASAHAEKLNQKDTSKVHVIL